MWSTWLQSGGQNPFSYAYGNDCHLWIRTWHRVPDASSEMIGHFTTRPHHPLDGKNANSALWGRKRNLTPVLTQTTSRKWVIKSLVFHLTWWWRWEFGGLRGLCSSLECIWLSKQEPAGLALPRSKTHLCFKVSKTAVLKAKARRRQHPIGVLSRGLRARSCRKCGNNLWGEKGRQNSIGVRCLPLHIDLPGCDDSSF